MCFTIPHVSVEEGINWIKTEETPGGGVGDVEFNQRAGDLIQTYSGA